MATKNNNLFALYFYITDVIQSSKLEEACFASNLLKRVNVLKLSVPLSLPQIQSKNADIFDGIGTYDKEYDILI